MIIARRAAADVFHCIFPVGSVWSLVSICCIALLTCSGRVGTSDSGGELQAALVWARGHTLGLPVQPAYSAPLWVRAPNQRYYQAHDIGGTLLLVPAAWIGSRGASLDLSNPIPPLRARVIGSIEFSILFGVGTWFYLLTLQGQFGRRRGTALLAVFASATFIWPYSRSIYDVVGAYVGVAAMLYFANHWLLPNRELRMSDAIGMATGLAVAGSFRFSLLPFLILSLLVLLVIRRRQLGCRCVQILIVWAMVLLAPALLYNALRTGSPLRPPTTAPQFASMNGLDGNIVRGSLGVIAGPNVGILAFAPIFILVVGLPSAWHRATPALRTLLKAFAPGLIGYLLLIAKLRAWHGIYGWGPRYVVPVLPVLFLAIAWPLISLWHRRFGTRLALGILIGVSALINLPAQFANWQLAYATFPGAAVRDSSKPALQLAAWDMLRRGARGESPVEVRSANAADDVRAGVGIFPDLLLCRIAERSPAAAMLALALTTILLSTSAIAGHISGRSAPSED